MHGLERVGSQLCISLLGSSHARIQYINFNFSIEKLSTHIAEEQLLFQPHVEPPLLKFPEYYLAYNKLSKQSRKVFFYTAKMVNMAGNEFFDLERVESS